MRAGDLAPPAIPAHPIPPSSPSAGWHGTPIVGLEYLGTGDLWDDLDTDVDWDAGKVWDSAGTTAGYSDVWCDTTGLEIVHGEPDDTEIMAPSRCTLTLYDPTGKYRRRTPDGRLIYYAAGRRLVVLAEVAGVRWWLFAGKVATWHELADGFVEIVGYGIASTLAQAPGKKWTAGTAGETLRPRAAAIVAASGVAGVTLEADVGTVNLIKPAAEKTAPLEALQQAAWSDGGIVHDDADGALIVRDRYWRNGRADQPTPPTILTDNICGGPNIVVWEAELAHDDAWLAGRVVLQNTAGLEASYTNPAELIDPALMFTHAGDDLWTSAPEGSALAAFIATQRGTQRLALGLARIYLHDARLSAAVWSQIVNVRLGDLVRWQHRDTWADAEIIVDVNVIAATVRHLLTADTWIVEIESTPAVTFTDVPVWNFTAYRWNDTDPAADWR